jgi:hypothetical protein
VKKKELQKKEIKRKKRRDIKRYGKGSLTLSMLRCLTLQRGERELYSLLYPMK